MRKALAFFSTTLFWVGTNMPGTSAAQHGEIYLPKLEKILPCRRHNGLRMQTAWGSEQVSHTHSLAWSHLDLAGVRMSPSPLLWWTHCQHKSYTLLPAETTPSALLIKAYPPDFTSLSILSYFSTISPHWDSKVICSLLRWNSYFSNSSILPGPITTCPAKMSLSSSVVDSF